MYVCQGLEPCESLITLSAVHFRSLLENPYILMTRWIGLHPLLHRDTNGTRRGLVSKLNRLTSVAKLFKPLQMGFGDFIRRSELMNCSSDIGFQLYVFSCVLFFEHLMLTNRLTNVKYIPAPGNPFSLKCEMRS